MKIEDTTQPEAFLIGQIQGTLKCFADSRQYRLAQIARYIAEYEADQEERYQAERRNEERNDPMECPF